MSEYIERDKVIRELEWYIERFPDCAECLEARKSIIARIPSADVRPVVMARWKHRKDSAWSGGGCTECSACGFGYSDEYYHEVEEFNFCPNCGADMREEN